jgi:hypothetical protein
MRRARVGGVAGRLSLSGVTISTLGNGYQPKFTDRVTEKVNKPGKLEKSFTHDYLAASRTDTIRIRFWTNSDIVFQNRVTLSPPLLLLGNGITRSVSPTHLANGEWTGIPGAAKSNQKKRNGQEEFAAHDGLPVNLLIPFHFPSSPLEQVRFTSNVPPHGLN